MAVGVDNTGTKQVGGNPVTTTDFTFTVGSGLTDSALIVGIAMGANAAVSNLSGTWDTGGTNQALSVIGSASYNNGGYSDVALLGVLSPTPGTKTCTISWTGSNYPTCCAISLTGVEQSSVANAFKNFNSSTGKKTNPSVIITSATGDMVIGLLAAGTLTSISGTTIYTDTTSAGADSAMDRTAGAATVTVSGVTGNTATAICGVDVVASGSGATAWADSAVLSPAAVLGADIETFIFDSPTLTAGSIFGSQSTQWMAGVSALLPAASLASSLLNQTMQAGAALTPALAGGLRLNQIELASAALVDSAVLSALAQTYIVDLSETLSPQSAVGASLNQRMQAASALAATSAINASTQLAIIDSAALNASAAFGATAIQWMQAAAVLSPLSALGADLESGGAIVQGSSGFAVASGLLSSANQIVQASAALAAGSANSAVGQLLVIDSVALAAVAGLGSAAAQWVALLAGLTPLSLLGADLTTAGATVQGSAGLVATAGLAPGENLWMATAAALLNNAQLQAQPALSMPGASALLPAAAVGAALLDQMAAMALLAPEAILTDNTAGRMWQGTAALMPASSFGAATPALVMALNASLYGVTPAPVPVLWQDKAALSVAAGIAVQVGLNLPIMSTWQALSFLGGNLAKLIATPLITSNWQTSSPFLDGGSPKLSLENQLQGDVLLSAQSALSATRLYALIYPQSALLIAASLSAVARLISGPSANFASGTTLGVSWLSQLQSTNAKIGATTTLGGDFLFKYQWPGNALLAPQAVLAASAYELVCANSNYAALSNLAASASIQEAARAGLAAAATLHSNLIQLRQGIEELSASAILAAQLSQRMLSGWTASVISVLTASIAQHIPVAAPTLAAAAMSAMPELALGINARAAASASVNSGMMQNMATRPMLSAGGILSAHDTLNQAGIASLNMSPRIGVAEVQRMLAAAGLNGSVGFGGLAHIQPELFQQWPVNALVGVREFMALSPRAGLRGAAQLSAGALQNYSGLLRAPLSASLSAALLDYEAMLSGMAARGHLSANSQVSQVSQISLRPACFMSVGLKLHHVSEMHVPPIVAQRGLTSLIAKNAAINIMGQAPSNQKIISKGDIVISND